MPHDPIAAEAVVQELFNTPEGRRDPYARYHRLRELDPVHYSPNLDSWFVSRYADCAAMLRDPRFGKDYARDTERRFGADWRRHPSLAAGEHSMLNASGPAHTRLRRMVVKGFTRRTIERQRGAIERITNELLDPFEAAGGGDLLTALGFPMPVRVIGELLGVPEEDRDRFRPWVLDLTATLEMSVSEDQLEAADAAQLEIRRYFDELIEAKRSRPDDALLSQLVHLEDDGDRLTQDELASMSLLLFAAGFETTTNLIGNGLYGMLRQPEQVQELRSQPELLEQLPDEILRFDGTAQMAVRCAMDDVEVGDRSIPTGATVFAMLGSANHDPAEFADPDRIDVKRSRFRPMSFGGGVHFCLGASLAKLEIETVFRSLLQRFDTIELSGEVPRHRDRLTLRGLESLELEVTPCAVRRSPRTAGADDAGRFGAAAWIVPPTGRPPSEGLRPANDSDSDRRWRNELRAKVEGDAKRPDPRWLLEGADLAGTSVLLARAELFRGCTVDEIARLAATAYPMSFEAGDRLCVEGAESLECYVIAEGEALVTISGERIRKVGENDVVGERGPLEGTPRTATVTARTHMVTYAISRQRLLELVETSPRARQSMFRHMQERYVD